MLIWINSLGISGAILFISFGPYNIEVIINPKPLSLSAVLSIISLLGMICLLLATSPVDKIAYAMIFFLLLLIFLVSCGHLMIRRFKGEVKAKDRYRLFIISIFFVILLMFRSAQSLDWLAAVILAIVTFGLLFYSSRRA